MFAINTVKEVEKIKEIRERMNHVLQIKITKIPLKNLGKLLVWACVHAKHQFKLQKLLQFGRRL